MFHHFSPQPHAFARELKGSRGSGIEGAFCYGIDDSCAMADEQCEECDSASRARLNQGRCKYAAAYRKRGGSWSGAREDAEWGKLLLALMLIVLSQPRARFVKGWIAQVEAGLQQGDVVEDGD